MSMLNDQRLHNSSDNIRLNVVLEASPYKFVIVTKKQKTIKELMEQLQEDALEYLK